MARLLLTDEEWDLIADAFPKPAATGRPPRDPRQVVDGILWGTIFHEVFMDGCLARCLTGCRYISSTITFH